MNKCETKNKVVTEMRCVSQHIEIYNEPCEVLPEEEPLDQYPVYERQDFIDLL